jgi:succinoglycan biosynthesis transport protein ExoP
VDTPAYGCPTDGDAGELAQYWHILTQRKGTLLLVALLGALTAFSLSRLQSPIYRARTLLEIESLNDDFLNMRHVIPTVSGEGFLSPEYNIRTQALVVQSRPVLEQAIQKMDIEKRLLVSTTGGRNFPWRKKPELEAIPQTGLALQAAAEGLKVHTEPNTRVLEVSFDSSDPQLAADFVNSIATGFTELSLERRWETSQYTSKWLAREMQDVKTKLEKAEDVLQRYARAFDLTFISEKENTAEERLRQLQLALSQAHTDRVTKQSEHEIAATAPPDSLPKVLDDPTLKDYQVELTDLRRQLAELSYLFTPEHPKVAKVQSQIATVAAALEKKRSNIVSRMRNEFEAARQSENMLIADYAAQLEFMSKQTDKVTRYLMLKREVESTRQLYDSMYQRVKEASLASAMRAVDIHVIEQAKPSASPYKPNFFLNTALGLLSGICAGATFIIARARSNRGIQEPGETSFYLSVPELGVIPKSGTERDRVRRLLGKAGLQTLFSSDDLKGLELITWTITRGFQRWPAAVAECFRFTVTSILLAEQNGSPPRVIAVSSASPGEGKTTVISNLAIALARANRRVLLVDGDLSRPRLHRVFEVDNSVGLSDVLGGCSTLAVRETRIPNLFLLPSGKNSDETVCFTTQCRELFWRLKTEFDMILIDTAPLLLASDARLIGHQADSVILVVAQHTARDAVMLARQRLAEDGTYLLGTILNNWNPKTSIYGHRKYGGYYKDGYPKDESLRT